MIPMHIRRRRATAFTQTSITVYGVRSWSDARKAKIKMYIYARVAEQID